MTNTTTTETDDRSLLERARDAMDLASLDAAFTDVQAKMAAGRGG